MSGLSSSQTVLLGEASDRASHNIAGNLAALAQTQCNLDPTTPALPPDLHWVFARDGSLTAMLEGQHWWAGCSVPLAAARYMLKSIDIRGAVACFLSPLHAAQLRVALDLLARRQAILAIVPNDVTLAVLLHTGDFANDIAAGRLWIAAGEGWESELRRIFEDHPGLPTPVEFIRPITADPEPINALIEPAQRVFSEVSAARTAQVQSLSEVRRPATSPPRVCLLAPSEFRLWNDAAAVLAELVPSFGGFEVLRLDSDCPTSSSPLALARAASQCDVVLAADFFRSHLPGVVPEQVPWVTWATTPRIPPACDVGSKDRLLLASSSWLSSARRLGWDEARIGVAAWPVRPLATPPQRQLSIIADTQPLAVPKQVEEYSSQVLLWELIRDELMRDPFLAVDDIEGYLKSRRGRFQIGEDGFDCTLFAERLIVPAVQQGLARRLIKDAMPLRLFGRGWEELDGLAAHHGGPVESRADLFHIVSQSTALVHVWPWQSDHLIEMTGRPVIRTRRMHDFLSDARQALNGTLKPPAIEGPALSPERIAGALRSCFC